MATKSIGSSGRDYATLALWTAYVNALALAAPEIGECYNDSEFTVSSGLTLGGWTGGSGTNTVTLKCATGQSFRDNANVLTNALRYNQSNGVGINVNAGYVTGINVTTDFVVFDGLQWKASDTAVQGLVRQSGHDNTTVKNCLFYGTIRNGNTALAIAGGSSAATNCAIIITSNVGNGLFLESGPSATDVSVLSSNSSSGTGVVPAYSSASLVKNVAVAGFTTDYSGTVSASSTNNATDKGSFGGTNYGGSGQTSLVGSTEWQSVTNGSEDLRLKSTSAKLKDNGATAGPANDIAGTSRPQGSAYDIGCWEYVSASVVTVGEMVAAANMNQPPIRIRIGVVSY